MNPRRLLSRLSWIRFAIVVAVIGTIGTAAFRDNSAAIGWIAFALLTLYVALRVATVVVVRRALAKAAITPPEPVSPDQRERRIRQYVITRQGTLSIVAWSIAAAVGRRRRKAAPQP